MLLVVDVGNTNIVFGLFQKGKLSHSWRIATVPDRTADELAIVTQNLLGLQEISFDDISAVSVCSVVPALDGRLAQLSRDYLECDPLFVRPEAQTVMPVHYSPASDLGPDRLINAIAAYDLTRQQTIVIDFGTATTFDAVSSSGEYLGGLILPGVGISAEALSARGARLPRIEIRKPARMVGDSTVACMQSGVFYGYVSMVEGIISRLKTELGDATVLATGGLAGIVAGEAKGIDRVDEHLTLEGLRIFTERSGRA